MASPDHPTPGEPSEKSQPPAPVKGKGKRNDEKKDDDLSEEDLALKEQLELYVLRAQDADPGVQKLALESMRQEIRSATSSMTSVPKPLKFLRPHYGTLKSYFETMPESELKKYMADILSVLALTMSVEGERESLKYRLLGSEGDIGSWGHEYVRNLAGEIAQEFQKRQDDDLPIDALMELVQQIVSFHMKVNVMDTLSRLSHDADADVSMAAIISLGLIGAGTNNARIAGMLRNLSSYYYKEAAHLFCVRIAQGLVHLGKGLLTLSPYHSDRFLLSPMALGGLVTVLHACLDMKSTILGKYHYILYIIVLAMQPRMLLTVDEDLKPLSVPVRVGQAVDVVGQAGRPKTITGFQTHSTPVLLAAGERAELATEKYIPLTPVLEGFVILKKNPEYHEE